MSTRCLSGYRSDGESHSERSSGGLSGSGGERGNSRLAAMTPMQVRSLLKGELQGDAAAQARYREYQDDWRDREARMATGAFRGFARGERRQQ